jgi:hypothetical protein
MSYIGGIFITGDEAWKLRKNQVLARDCTFTDANFSAKS